MFDLIVHHTGQAWDGLRSEDISKASGHCSTPAIDASAVPTSVAMVLFGVHWFVADEARCAFIGARLYNACGVEGRRVQRSWLLKRGCSDPQPRTRHCSAA